MAIQQSLIIIKPDSLIKSLAGNILSVLSETKLKVVGAKVLKVPKEIAEKHYESHKEEPFYKELINYITGKYNTDRVFAMVYHDKDAIKRIREIAGSANPE